MRVRMYLTAKVVHGARGPSATPHLTVSNGCSSSRSLFFFTQKKNDYLPKIRRTKKRSQIFPNCGGFADEWIWWESKHSNFWWMGCLKRNRLFAKVCRYWSYWGGIVLGDRYFYKVLLFSSMFNGSSNKTWINIKGMVSHHFFLHLFLLASENFRDRHKPPIREMKPKYRHAKMTSHDTSGIQSSTTVIYTFS